MYKMVLSAKYLKLQEKDHSMLLRVWDFATGLRILTINVHCLRASSREKRYRAVYI